LRSEQALGSPDGFARLADPCSQFLVLKGPAD
jgi:hypothetical protein